MNSGFPFDQIKLCQSCDLCKSCSGPVPGVGPVPARVMLLGEAPGEEEDKVGEPFVGRSGRFLKYLLSSIGWSREQCYITNVIKCRPPNNAGPTAGQVSACAHWLDIELGLVKPEILVLLGGTAIKRVLGPLAGTVEHLHGSPIIQSVDGHRRVLLPGYHPAAALYDTAQLRLVYDDFHVLQGLLAGDDPEQYIVKDDFPNPDYVEIADGRHLDWLHGLLQAAARTDSVVAADVETVNNRLWSVQVCATPGTAYFVGPELSPRFHFPDDLRVVFHNYLYDYQFIRASRFLDTMVMAYQLGLPQGLKELASRLRGMEMQSYDDLVSGAGRGNAVDYLSSVAARDWPKPEPVTEFKWDNKAGKVIDRVRKPQPILQKAKRILADCSANPGTDPVKRWKDIDQSERAVAESVLGPMPESTIADIPRPKAVWYACRDSDATQRVYRAMLPKVREYGLEFILGVDLAVLPVVQEMMDVGIALDVNHLRGLSAEYAGRMAEVAADLALKAGHAFNPGSSPQVAAVVYKELGFAPTRFTGGGAVSTDDRELKKINHPIVKDILEYRRIAKNKDAFADALLERAKPHGSHYRIHTTLKATRTETGRLSSADPNLQAMPVRYEEGKRIRRGFVATKEEE